MDTAIVVTCITCGITLFGGILIVLIKKTFDFLSLKSTLQIELARISTKLKEMSNENNLHDKRLMDHISNYVLKQELACNARQNLQHDLTKVRETFSNLEVRHVIDNKDYDKIVSAIERLERSLEK